MKCARLSSPDAIALFKPALDQVARRLVLEVLVLVDELLQHLEPVHLPLEFRMIERSYLGLLQKRTVT